MLKLPVLLGLVGAAVIASGCHLAAAETCEEFVKTFNLEAPTAASLAQGQTIVAQYGASGVRACEDIKLLLSDARTASERLDEESDALAARLVRTGEFIAPALKQKLRTCVETCQAGTRSLTGCMTTCGCSRVGFHFAAATQNLEGTFSCPQGPAGPCGARCSDGEGIAQREAEGIACRAQCTREIVVVLGDAERALELSIAQGCCAAVNGAWTEGACVAPEPVWLAVCRNNRGRRSKPTPQECCAECGAAATESGCKPPSVPSDLCFVGCLNSLNGR